MESTGSESESQQSPPRAFTQGVGTVYQVVGATLFLVMMFVCCGSGLMSMETAKREDLAQIGWRVLGPDGPMYSAQKAISVALTVAVGLGVAVASIGLGLQGTRPKSPVMAVVVSGIGTGFWLFHTLFFAMAMKSIWLAGVCGVLLIVFGGLLALAVASFREMRRDPPPPDQTILPAGYKVPYSHLHE